MKKGGTSSPFERFRRSVYWLNSDINFHSKKSEVPTKEFLSKFYDRYERIKNSSYNDKKVNALLETILSLVEGKSKLKDIHAVSNLLYEYVKKMG